MANLYIAEYSGGTVAGNPIALMPPLAEQKVAISGSSTQSAAFGGGTKLVRIQTDVICSLAFGSNPTATTSNARFPADQTEYFAVNPGDMVAVITNT